MSIMAESNIYESMADDGLNEKLCLTACDASSEFMFIPKIERNIEGATRVVSEKIEEETTELLHDGIIQDTYDSTGQPTIYYEEAFSACEEVVEYKPSITSVSPASNIEDEWVEGNQFENDAVDSSFDETQVAMSYRDESENVDDSDEETIATFLTAAGQRLALYAVEDSDEVFAVAVYDESGTPPTNFQFLMKADVERLIGEGAVRTVKKPTLIKKQVFETDLPLLPQHIKEQRVEEPQLTIQSIEPTQYQNNQYNTHKTTCNKDTDLSSNEIVQETERKFNPLLDADMQSNFKNELMEDAYPTFDRIEEKFEAEETTVENDCRELIEESTVQRILLGEEDSDSELTFADIEETLKKYKSNDENKSLLKKILIRTNVDSTEDHLSLNGMLISNAMQDDVQKVEIPTNTGDYIENCLNYPKKSCKNMNFARKEPNSLICKHENFIDERLNDSSGTSLLVANSEANISPKPSAPSETVQIASKVKRSRKQQLTSVNRDDSEIIIQPANFTTNEEVKPTKKRGRGKRKPGRPPACKVKAVVTKKLRRSRRPRPVELIEIDVDEEDRLQGKKNIVEITIDENKEKGSSDKENEVIMVGDSEDEKEEAEASKSSTSILRCDHCLRSFRQKRALETHSRICPKSPNALRRINEKSARRSSTRSNDSSTVKKQYSCKICHEKFDVVVVLARHVRLIHSQRKKVNSSLQTTKPPDSPSKIQDTPKKNQHSESVTSISPRMKTKTKIKASNRSWKSKKLHCADCGRWFSSDALLTAHSLKHATKKSEKQARRCQTCKKLFKSRLLYIRHMRMHSRAKQLQKKLHHTQQTTSKKTTLRKRGRSRKL